MCVCVCVCVCVPYLNNNLYILNKCVVYGMLVEPHQLVNILRYIQLLMLTNPGGHYINDGNLFKCKHCSH